MLSDAFDGKRFFAAASFLSAALTLLLVLTAAPASGPPADVLSYFMAHRSRLVTLAVVVLSWAIVSVLHVIAIGRLAAANRPMLAIAGAALSSGGILLLGFGTFIYVGSFFSIAAASQAARDPTQGNFHALVWWNLSFMLSDPGLMTLGAGQAILGCLAWKASALPRYTGAIGVGGGLAGLLTLAVYQTPVLAIVQLLAFGAVAAIAGIALSREKEAPIARRDNNTP